MGNQAATPSASSAEADANGETASAGVATYEGDEGGGVDGADAGWAWSPTPASADLGPAAVMEGREAPRGVVDPGVAPGGDVGPVAGGVGAPAVGDVVGEPDGAVLGVGLPGAVGIEVGVANHLRADVAGGDGVLVTLVEAGAPGVQGVVLGEVGVLELDGVGAMHLHGVAAGEGLVDAGPGDDGVAGEDDEVRGAAGLVGVNAVVAGGLDEHGAVGGIDLNLAAGVEGEDAEVDGALGEGELVVLVGEVGEGDVGALADAELGAAELEDGAGGLGGVDAVAADHGVVGRGEGPVVGAIGLEGDVAGEVGEAGYAGGRVAGILGVGSSGNEERGGDESLLEMLAWGCLRRQALWRALPVYNPNSGRGIR